MISKIPFFTKRNQNFLKKQLHPGQGLSLELLVLQNKEAIKAQ